MQSSDDEEIEPRQSLSIDMAGSCLPHLDLPRINAAGYAINLPTFCGGRARGRQKVPHLKIQKISRQNMS